MIVKQTNTQKSEMRKYLFVNTDVKKITTTVLTLSQKRENDLTKVEGINTVISGKRKNREIIPTDITEITESKLFSALLEYFFD